MAIRIGPLNQSALFLEKRSMFVTMLIFRCPGKGVTIYENVHFHRESEYFFAR